MQVKKMATAAFSLLAFSLLTQCSQQGEPPKSGDTSAAAAAPMPAADRISMAEFKKLLAADEVVVLDVRANSAYVGGHIPGALSMPEETLNSAAAEKLKRMGKPIATYCS